MPVVSVSPPPPSHPPPAVSPLPSGLCRELDGRWHAKQLPLSPEMQHATVPHAQQTRMASSSSMLFYVPGDHKDYLGRGAQDSHLDFHTVPGLWRISVCLFQCCFTTTETILRTIWDGKPRTATSTFTQLPSSDGWQANMVLKRPQKQ